VTRHLPVIDLAVALGAFAYFVLHSHFPWQLAMLLGLAMGAFSLTARRTAQSLWLLYRPRPPVVSSSSDETSGDSSPEESRT